MARKFGDAKLVVASHNAGKVREITELMEPLAVETVSADALGLAEPDETGATFRANAELKARAAAASSGLASLADDSGLCVDALGGQPGIHSARWAGPARDFDAAMMRVDQELKAAGADMPDTRRATFVAALALAWPDGHIECVEGRVNGTLVWPPRGARGFGYDPIFQLDGYDITFGEMDPAHKHAISHRAVAFARLLSACFEIGTP